jgi:hypothetical protein
MSAKSNLLKKKTITIINTRRSCLCCGGSGHTPGGTVQASRFKNLKVSGSITIENDCAVCKGSGIVSAPIRKVLKQDRRGPIVI